MVDRARILSVVDVVDQQVRLLHEFVPQEFESYTRDERTRLATERVLQVGIEALVDLAALLVSAKRLGLPRDEEGILARLRERGVLSVSETEILGDLRRFRNVLVHQYGRLDQARVHDHALREERTSGTSQMPSAEPRATSEPAPTPGANISWTPWRTAN